MSNLLSHRPAFARVPREAFPHALWPRLRADVPLGDIRPMAFGSMRLGKDHEYSSASLWVKDAREHGLID